MIDFQEIRDVRSDTESGSEIDEETVLEKRISSNGYTGQNGFNKTNEHISNEYYTGHISNGYDGVYNSDGYSLLNGNFGRNAVLKTGYRDLNMNDYSQLNANFNGKLKKSQTYSRFW